MKILKVLILCGLVWSCQTKNKSSEKITPLHKTITPTFQNKGHELVYNMAQKAGTYQQLLDLKDVVYNYTYITPDHKKDSVTEKYIFDGEFSYGKYHQHQRTLPNIKGVFEQGYDGEHFWIKSNGTYLNDEAARQKVTFNRITNFYWFAMFQKLLDPGIHYEYLKDEVIDDQNYHIVKISFNTNDDKPSDIYQIYINEKTKLIDQFLFTVAAYGVIDTPLLMKVEYEEINGLFIPTKRKYTKATWDGKNITENWIYVNWSNIKFNNGLTKDIFESKK